MERRVRERLIGAGFLAALVVLVVPEILSGPKPAQVPKISQVPVRNVTVDLSASANAPPTPTPTPAPAPASAPAPTAMPAPQAPLAPTPQLTSAPVPLPVPDQRVAPVAVPPRDHSWSVQLGSFAGHGNADKLLGEIHANQFPGYLSTIGAGSSQRYRVRVGPYKDRETALRALAKLKVLRHTGSIVPPADVE